MNESFEFQTNATKFNDRILEQATFPSWIRVLVPVPVQGGISVLVQSLRPSQSNHESGQFRRVHRRNQNQKIYEPKKYTTKPFAQQDAVGVMLIRASDECYHRMNKEELRERVLASYMGPTSSARLFAVRPMDEIKEHDLHQNETEKNITSIALFIVPDEELNKYKDCLEHCKLVNSHCAEQLNVDLAQLSVLLQACQLFAVCDAYGHGDPNIPQDECNAAANTAFMANAASLAPGRGVDPRGGYGPTGTATVGKMSNDEDVINLLVGVGEIGGTFVLPDPRTHNHSLHNQTSGTCRSGNGSTKVVGSSSSLRSDALSFKTRPAMVNTPRIPQNQLNELDHKKLLQGNKDIFYMCFNETLSLLKILLAFQNTGIIENDDNFVTGELKRFEEVLKAMHFNDILQANHEHYWTNEQVQAAIEMSVDLLQNKYSDREISEIEVLCGVVALLRSRKYTSMHSPSAIHYDSTVCLESFSEGSIGCDVLSWLCVEVLASCKDNTTTFQDSDQHVVLRHLFKDFDFNQSHLVNVLTELLRVCAPTRSTALAKDNNTQIADTAGMIGIWNFKTALGMGGTFIWHLALANRNKSKLAGMLHSTCITKDHLAAIFDKHDNFTMANVLNKDFLTATKGNVYGRGLIHRGLSILPATDEGELVLRLRGGGGRRKKGNGGLGHAAR
jgi:hypothetical protein